MESNSILDREHIDHSIEILSCIRKVITENSKSISSQISEILRLSFGVGKIAPEEYYYYRLYDDNAYSPSDKQKFLGKNAQTAIYLLCNTPTWWYVAHDKLAFHALMRGLGLPVPDIRAILHPFRRFGAAPALRDAARLTDFLVHEARFPLFGKPVAGMWSEGISALDGVDPTRRTLRLSNDRTVGLDAYAAEVASYLASGYLFQEKLVPHPLIERICGDLISTARVIVMVTDTGPEILRSVWKIPAGGNLADNFWRPGNLLADIDPASGTVRRVVRGVGPDQMRIEHHPDSGERLDGLTLPDWPRLTELCLVAAAALPELRLQAWDIAMCDRGPVLLEVNIGGDFNLPQVASGEGLLDQRFRDFLDSCRARQGGFWARFSRRRIARRATRA